MKPERQEPFVRPQALEHLLAPLRAGSALSPHLLLVGPHGVGKAALLQALCVAVRQDPLLAAGLCPLYIPGVCYHLTTLEELWEELCSQLIRQGGHDGLLRVLEGLRGEAKLEQLLDQLERRGQRLLLGLERLDLLLEEQLSHDAQAGLWRLLSQEKRLIWVATAERRLETQVGDESFAPLMRVHPVLGLSLSALKPFWHELSGQTPTEGALRPLQLLTEGRPGLLKPLAQEARRAGAQDSHQHLLTLAQFLRDRCAFALETLPGQERKIFLALARLWRPGSTRDIAELTAFSPNEVSVLLGRLEKRHRVEVVRLEGRKKWYQLQDRPLQLALLVRPPGPELGRLERLLRFMDAFYSGEDGLAEPTGLLREKLEAQEEALKLGLKAREGVGELLRLVEVQLRLGKGKGALKRLSRVWELRAGLSNEQALQLLLYLLGLRRGRGLLSSVLAAARAGKLGQPVETLRATLLERITHTRTEESCWSLQLGLRLHAGMHLLSVGWVEECQTLVWGDLTLEPLEGVLRELQGSLGWVPREVLEVSQDLRREVEGCRRQLLPGLG